MSASIITKINPVNKEEEKKKFLFDQQYNPQFKYDHEFTVQEYEKFGQISDQYLKQAKSIIDSVIKKYGSERKFLEEVEGPIITREEVESILHEYIKENKIEQHFKVTFTRNVVSRTAMDQDEMKIRLPIEYRKHAFQGILNHEIGTHYFRTLNDRLAPWHDKRGEFGMRPKTQTEEGLALIHQFISAEEPYLWITGLYYYGTWCAHTMSFAELNKELMPYIEDPERRWKLCLKIKRGMKDTSLPGGFSREQRYLSGVFEVLHYLEEHEYNPEQLYAGKIAVADVDRARKLTPDRKYLLPEFLQKMSPEEYKKGIQRIKKFNFHVLHE
ncbi:MAG: tyrosine/phenylalanine carboxypeptidase domain-containing protein [Patescibacteria group bacterium]